MEVFELVGEARERLVGLAAQTLELLLQLLDGLRQIALALRVLLRQRRGLG